jgi:hypothetical protein
LLGNEGEKGERMKERNKREIIRIEGKIDDTKTPNF